MSSWTCIARPADNGTNIDDSWSYPWLFESPEAQNQLIGIWKRIADHYRNNPTVLGYDLLNEPIPHFPELQKYNNALEPLYRRVTAASPRGRSRPRDHPGRSAVGHEFLRVWAPFDSNVMYTFHKYCMTPLNETPFRPYLDFRERYHVPIWLSESRENTRWHGSGISRTVLEQEQIGLDLLALQENGGRVSIVSCLQPAHLLGRDRRLCEDVGAERRRGKADCGSSFTGTNQSPPCTTFWRMSAWSIVASIRATLRRSA